MSSRAHYLLRRVLRDVARHPRSWWRRLVRPSRVRLFGIELLADDRLSAKVCRILSEERFEHEEALALDFCLEPHDSVLELGTGLGLLAIMAARRVGSERVTTYEANPHLLSIIRENFAMNGVTPTLIHALAGLGDGEGAFHLGTEFYSSSVRRRPTSRERIRVPQVDIRREILRLQPSFLVMDIEGAEAELLPALPWAPIRKLLVELHPDVIGADRADELVLEVEARGFLLDRVLSTQQVKYFERLP